MTTATATAPADKMMEKIRKLLAQAEAFGVTEAEAQVFNARAAELMARHGIEQHMLAAAAAAAAQALQPAAAIRRVDAPFPHQKKDMLVWVADAMRLHPVIHRDPPPPELAGKYRYVLSVELFGAPADIDRCFMLFNSLLAQATRLIRDELGPGRGSAYKQSWLNGFAARVAALVRDAEATAVRRYDDQAALAPGGNPGAALVLREWDDRVAEFRASLYPKLGTAKARKSSGNGFGAGYAAGAKADITSRRALG